MTRIVSPRWQLIWPWLTTTVPDWVRSIQALRTVLAVVLIVSRSVAAKPQAAEEALTVHSLAAAAPSV